MQVGLLPSSFKEDELSMKDKAPTSRKPCAHMTLRGWSWQRTKYEIKGFKDGWCLVRLKWARCNPGQLLLWKTAQLSAQLKAMILWSKIAPTSVIKDLVRVLHGASRTTWIFYCLKNWPSASFYGTWNRSERFRCFKSSDFHVCFTLEFANTWET